MKKVIKILKYVKTAIIFEKIPILSFPVFVKIPPFPFAATADAVLVAACLLLTIFAVFAGALR